MKVFSPTKATLKKVCDTNFVDIRNDPKVYLEQTRKERAVPRNQLNCTVLEGSFGINLLNAIKSMNNTWVNEDQEKFWSLYGACSF